MVLRDGAVFGKAVHLHGNVKDRVSEQSGFKNKWSGLVFGQGWGWCVCVCVWGGGVL